MKFQYLVIVLCVLLSFSNEVFAEDAKTATVLLMRGEAEAKLPDGQVVAIKINQKIPEGAELTTSAKSFIKLIMADKSTINLGPSSSLVIKAFPQKEAGIIRLIQGQVRAEVSKNYLEMKDKDKSKLYIHTKTAAMGIRGTDFQVNYNPANQNSSLIVFEGSVAMAHIDRAIQNEAFAPDRLETIVTSSTAVMVKQGQMSAVNLNISDRATIPTKLDPKQLDALKENPTGNEESARKKQFRDVVPPGVDSSAFINAPAEIKKVEMKEAKSFFNEKTREYKPAAGSILDLKTVSIIAPAPEAKFDYATKTFVMPENYGKIDKKSGQFNATAGYEVSKEGQLKPVIREPVAKAPLNTAAPAEEIKRPVTPTGLATGPIVTAPIPPPVVKPIIQNPATINNTVNQQQQDRLKKVIEERAKATAEQTKVP